MRFGVLALGAVLLVGACQSHPTAKVQAPNTPTPSQSTIVPPSPGAEPSPTPDTSSPAHVFVIVLENRSYSQVAGNGYALKHDPFAYYGGQCPSQVVPFTQFAGDMSGNVPRFVWITPNLCHDGHDCPNADVNAWLAQTVPTILSSDAWKNNGVLFI